MKLNLDNFLLKYSSEISQAKANNFEALIIPIYDYEVYPLNNINDKDFINEIAWDCGWEEFILIDFINNTKRVIDLSLEAA